MCWLRLRGAQPQREAIASADVEAAMPFRADTTCT
jgi:hypothetical protein